MNGDTSSMVLQVYNTGHRSVCRAVVAVIWNSDVQLWRSGQEMSFLAFAYMIPLCDNQQQP